MKWIGKEILYWIIAALLVASLVLTYISSLKLCTEQCSANADYKLLGLPFEIWGFIFFTATLVSHLAARWRGRLHWLTLWMLAGAGGAELWFIYLQKYAIGSWCPLCLSIAACVFLALAGLIGLLYLIWRQQQKNSAGGMNMHVLFGSTVSCLALSVGFFAAFIGISQVDPLAAAEKTLQDKLAFGKANSELEVYFFTDWQCPSCRKIEPEIEDLAPSIMQQARLIFVDLPVHNETINFAPYNLSFIVNNSDKYLQLRRILTELSTKTTAPTEEQVTKAVAALVPKYKQISYADIAMGMKYYEALAKQFSVTSTPTVVIVNSTTRKGKKLKGAVEISAENIQKALETLKS